MTSAAFQASAQSPAAGAPQLTPDADVEAAIRAACQQLGKPFAEDAVAVLHANWYSTAGDLAALPDEAARSLGVPLRLKQAVAELLAAGSTDVEAAGMQGGGSDAAATAAAAAAALGDTARQLPAGVERLLDGTLPGSGSGGDAAGQSLSAAVAALNASGAAAMEWDQSHLPIEERRCPPMQRFGNRLSDAPAASKRGKAERYALSVRPGPTSPRLLLLLAPPGWLCVCSRLGVRRARCPPLCRPARRRR